VKSPSPSAARPTEPLAALSARLRRHGQEHLLAFHDELPAALRHALIAQIDALDFEELVPLIDAYVRRAPALELPHDLQPAPYYAAGIHARQGDGARFRDAGESLIRAGKVAAFTVAGGQGTRLGWSGPKGTYPASVVTGKPLFRCFAEQVLANQRRYRAAIPWYIMTSPINDRATREFFQDNNYFGLDPRNVMMFPQGVMPSMEIGTGRILLAEKHELAMNPDGHGGSIRALRASGAIEDLRSRGIEHISYFQVDNPLVKVIDPLFLGLHIEAPDSSAEMSSKMVAKVSPEEKVGVFCRVGGKTTVIEYSDLPARCAEEREASGRLRFIAGSIAIHLMSVAFVDRLTADTHRFALPWHRAVKKVPHVDPHSGQRIDPSEPNAVKLESFVFDALPLAERSIVLETGRVEEFAPIKNAEGVDSPASSHQLQSDRGGAWLEAQGVSVPHNSAGHVAARIEISPLTALEADDLSRIKLPQSINLGGEVVL
jgi:UDP-N-acetylglucosamine/UDP-N-acetylgalactosamine diphosphorylase